MMAFFRENCLIWKSPLRAGFLQCITPSETHLGFSISLTLIGNEWCCKGSLYQLKGVGKLENYFTLLQNIPLSTY